MSSVHQQSARALDRYAHSTGVGCELDELVLHFVRQRWAPYENVLTLPRAPKGTCTTCHTRQLTTASTPLRP